MNRSHAKQWNRQRPIPRPILGGFTLIELLVVVGIIAVLMAILLPALGRARAEVHKISCGSNLRQWGTAVQAFAGDNDNFFPNPGIPWDPRPYRFWEDTQQNIEWHGFFNEYLVNYDHVGANRGENVVQFCPVGAGHMRVHSFGHLGYFYLAHRGTHSGTTYVPEVNNAVSRRHFDGGYARAPFMSDNYWIHDGGMYDGQGHSFSSHISKRCV